MPIEYKVFGCKFKCGRRRVQDRSIIEDHEFSCWYNLDNQTCKTCKHEDYGFDYGASPQDGWFNRECKSPNEKAQEWIEEAYGEFEESMNKDYRGQIPPVTDCPYWENKKIKKEKQ